MSTIYVIDPNDIEGRLLPRVVIWKAETPDQRRRRILRTFAERARACDARGGIWGAVCSTDRIGP